MQKLEFDWKMNIPIYQHQLILSSTNYVEQATLILFQIVDGILQGFDRNNFHLCLNFLSCFYRFVVVALGIRIVLFDFLCHRIIRGKEDFSTSAICCYDFFIHSTDISDSPIMVNSPCPRDVASCKVLTGTIFILVLIFLAVSTASS